VHKTSTSTSKLVSTNPISKERFTELYLELKVCHGFWWSPASLEDAPIVNVHVYHYGIQKKLKYPMPPLMRTCLA
jgi:hypothetical protein